MPESKIRKTAAEKKKVAAKAAAVEAKKKAKTVAPGSGAWVVPTFITVGLLGVAWLVVYYVASTTQPPIYIPLITAAPPEPGIIGDAAGLGGWNIIVGMGLMALCFVIATQWGKKG
ncbi:MAG: cell division protein CrgA [Propionibacteriaceae bacterium]|nr:cell division protein CrgA [Propionibacteriaceae bacterium]